MYSETYKNQPSVAGLLVIAAVIIVVLTFAVIALSTGDILWFWPRNDNQPSAIVVHCYSENVTVDPRSGHFAEINSIVNEALSGQKRWDPLSLSDITYQEYLTHPNMMTLEVTYPKPVRIHTNTAFFSNVDTLLIPLDARHSAKNVVFGRTLAGHPAAGSLFVDQTDSVREYLSEQGICEILSDSWWDASEVKPEDSPENQEPSKN
jgi:hypothetical protein